MIFGLRNQKSFDGYKIDNHRNMPVLTYKEPWKQENGLYKFFTIVSEVFSFVGNPVASVHSRLRNVN